MAARVGFFGWSRPLERQVQRQDPYARFVQALVSMGREQLQGQLEGSKQFDTKALGLLAAHGALASFTFANRNTEGPL